MFFYSLVLLSDSCDTALTPFTLQSLYGLPTNYKVRSSAVGFLGQVVGGQALEESDPRICSN